MEENKLKLLTEKFETPFYVFDTKVLRDRVHYLKNALGENLHLCYAVKANTFIIKEMIDQIEKFEICSPGELEICERLNVPVSKMVISGVYKSAQFIDDIVCRFKDECVYTVESNQQYALLKESANKYKQKIHLLLRLTHGSQFGINESDILNILEKDDEYVDIQGIQYFSGTQKNSVKKLRREINHMDEFLHRITEETGKVMREFEFGTGFPVMYFEGDEFLEDEFMKEFVEIMESMTYKAHIILEVGRSIAASCGSYVSKIVDKKTNKKQNYALIDGGMHHLVYFGQSMAMKHPFFKQIPLRDEKESDEWNICGSLCTMNDILVKSLPLKDFEIGDYLVFEKTGAYCMIEGISLFLSRDLPQIILYEDENHYHCVRPLTSTAKLNYPNY